MINTHVCIYWGDAINITIKDIARIAGVSHSTVSRSLNDSPRVKQATKDRIRAIAEEYDFEFNAGARSLSTKKTGTVGIIHPELYNDFSASLFCGSLISEIMKKLDRKGIDFIPVFSENRASASSNIQRLVRQHKVDAFIIVDSLISPEDWLFIKKRGMPFVQLHYRPKHDPGQDFNYIYSDNFTGGRLATDYLIEKGCRNILCITIKSEHTEILDRRAGYLRSLEEHGLTFNKEMMIEEECTLFNGEKLIRDNPDLVGKSDGIFVHADIMALGVIKELKRQGYRIPEDIRVIGYDDIELATYFEPKLTTVHQPKESLAGKACDILERILNGRTGGPVLIQDIIRPNLVVRVSA